MTTRQRLFIEHYKVTKNASESARLAGFSPKSAGKTGFNLLNRPKIADIIKAWEAEEIAKIVPKTKEAYVHETFSRAKTVNHPPTQAKYWEIGGKVAGYLSDHQTDGTGPQLNLIARELHLHLGQPIPAIYNGMLPNADAESTIDITNSTSTDQSVNNLNSQEDMGIPPGGGVKESVKPLTKIPTDLKSVNGDEKSDIQEVSEGDN